MSKQFISQYYNQVHAIKQAGAKNEGAISRAFYALLHAYAQEKKYLLIAEFSIKSTKTQKTIRPDGILMNELRIPRGYWESKDEFDDLDEEIRKKIHESGYPDSNILFEDGQTAVLIQLGQEILRANISEADKLHQILTAFIDFRPAEIQEFEKALAAFKEDIPEIAKTFRELFEAQAQTNDKYISALERFWELCKSEINPEISKSDISEMLVQHILTEDLFTTIFNDVDFLRYNVVARELEELISVVITREIRQNQLADIRHYYETLNATAARISDYHEKQKFLKLVYENFYKAYNPAGADRLGVVYTPNEIVRFMVESTNTLLEKHFEKSLGDKNVQILDPATGTGTFITDIIDFIAPQYLEHKFRHELHANEVSILPYYIANLNIEYTYKNKMGKYISYENICFVDTLDNTEALKYMGKQNTFFGFSSENAQRIQHQNSLPISVIIGNPPYNANQQNENDNNKNRAYPAIDERIKGTYIKHSTAQKTKVYDMYARFYRWAMDRVNKNGIIAFITNRSFIDSRTFDGFRKCVQDEFDYAYIIDTKSDVRANPKIAGTSHNVFGIQTGVAVMFLVRKDGIDKKCQIYYTSLTDEMLREEKLAYLAQRNLFDKIAFERIRPDKNNNWLNLAEESNWEDLLPLCDKNKAANTLFSLSSLGVSTNRDSWVYDYCKENLSNKMQFFIDKYENLLKSGSIGNDTIIKWSRDLKKKFDKCKNIIFDASLIHVATYRPYTKLVWYGEKVLNDILTQNHYDIFGKDLKKENKLIGFLAGNRLDFAAISTDLLPNLATFSLDPARYLPLYRYTTEGTRIDNITDWGAEQVRAHYGDASISKAEIFDYVYAVLHNPAYRKKYELNLKREFPRLPFYADFRKWAAWGKELMRLHINYESVKPYPLTRTERETPTEKPKSRLKADKEKGIIFIDDNTQLSDIPAAAWAYKLGNRSALEWVLDQYKETKISDPTLAEHFDTYRFADYKEKVIDLLMRLCTVSLETMRIIEEMQNYKH